MRVLVTGALGFIGRHVVDAIRQRLATEVVTLDRMPAGDPGADHLSISLIAERVDELAAAFRDRRIDAVVNCAGSASPNEDDLRRDNLESARVLMAAAEGQDVRITHLGSAAEYAPIPRPGRTGEDALEAPVSAYGRIKLETTRAFQAAAADGRVRAVILRVFNPIGRGMPAATLLGRVACWLRESDETTLQTGSLDSYRDYVDVRDVAGAIAASIEPRPDLNGRIVNVGSGRAHQTRFLLTEMLRLSGRPVTIEENREGSRQSAAVDWQEADITRAAEALGWRPSIAFDQTLRDLTT